MAEQSNPWLTVLEPIRDTKYDDRNLKEWNLWLGVIVVLNSDALTRLSGIVRVFPYRNSASAFCLGFGRSVEGYESCNCGRDHKHTHFILRVLGKVERETAYQMICAALHELQLQPGNYYQAFSYLASVFSIDYLLNTNMLFRTGQENNQLVQRLWEAQLAAYADHVD